MSVNNDINICQHFNLDELTALLFQSTASLSCKQGCTTLITEKLGHCVKCKEQQDVIIYKNFLTYFKMKVVQRQDM